MIRLHCRASTTVTLLCMVAGTVNAQQVTRHPIPESDFPITRAVEIPGDATVVHLNGAVPSVVVDTAPEGSAAAYGPIQFLLPNPLGSTS
jgi:hypothetical protein